MVTSNYHCQSSMLSKDVISDVMGSDSKDSEDLNEYVVIVEGDTDSDSACVNLKPPKAMVHTCCWLMLVMCSKIALIQALIQAI